eukprot:6795520-Prymnesium_polylepis.1
MGIFSSPAARCGRVGGYHGCGVTRGAQPLADRGVVAIVRVYQGSTFPAGRVWLGCLENGGG